MAYMVRNGRRAQFPLLSDFDQILERVFGTQPRWDLHYPAVDVREEDERYVLEAELPGLNEQDIAVRVEESLLVIESAVKEERQDGSDGNPHPDRRGRSFRRAFSLPKDVDRGNIEAVFTNGLLVLSLHKLPEAKPREIKIRKA